MTAPAEQTHYIAVDIHTFRAATRDISFDVYLRLSEDNFAHVFARSTGLDYRRLAQYIHKGVKQLYIRAEDEPAFREFTAMTADRIFSSPETGPEKKIATLLNMTEQNMAEIFIQLNVNEETAVSTQKVVKNYVNLLAESPKTFAIILKLVSHGDYLYYHSIAVAIFSLILAKATGQYNQSMLEIIGMGGFLHDIGKTQLPKEILESTEELTAAQWKEMRNHTKYGLTMIQNTPNIPDEVRYIVYQHHEEPSGKGYPNGLKSNVIFPPAKIVAVADAFSALLSRRPFRAAYSVEQALQILQAEIEKYDADLVDLLVSLFSQNKSSSHAA